MLLAVLLGALCLALGCAEPESDVGGAPDERSVEVGSQLSSPDPAVVAHAAYAAAQERLRHVVPDLVQALRHLEMPLDHRGYVMLEHILDALIQLDSVVPIEVLERFEEHQQASVLILASRNGDEARPLLRRSLLRNIRDQKIKVAGVAAGNLLAKGKDAELTALFLGSLAPLLHVTVVAQDSLPANNGLIGCGGHGDGVFTVPHDMPPCVWYELAFQDFGASTLLAEGPVAVWFSRWVVQKKRFVRGYANPDRDLTEVGLGWAATLLGMSVDALPLKRRYYHFVQWVDAEHFLGEVSVATEQIIRDGESMVGRLVEAGLLATADRQERVIRPRTVVDDQRGAGWGRLPAIPALSD